MSSAADQATLTPPLSHEEFLRKIVDERLLSPDQLLVAQHHVRQQNTDLRQALIDLRLLTPEQIARIEGDNDPTAAVPDLLEAPSFSGETPAAAEPAQAVADDSRFQRDLRAKLGAIAATAIPTDLIQQILAQSFAARATDVHLDPRSNRYTVRFRIDGQLHDMVELDRETGSAVIRGIKVSAQMDFLERRHALDAGMSVKIDGQARSIRVSSLPVMNGEKIVMRILSPHAINLGLERLGLENDQIDEIHQLLAQPYGVILVGGPVGSGKTTTLYSCLERLNHPSRNVMSIEDPVECHFDGVNQVEIDPKAGFRFAEGLRAILRQDPNVLMIGEIRDDETATIGIRAALTGVLVMSSIHASDAASVVGVLINFGIPGYTLASSLQGVLSQRLVRKICQHCRTAYKPDDRVLRALRLDPEQHRDLTLYHGRGCTECFHTGYRGRTGVYEVMPIRELLRDLIYRETTSDVIRTVARDEGMATLRESAIRKVVQGVTTVEEMYRVTT